MTLKTILTKMITRKNPDDALAGAAKGGLEKTLGVWDLIILGVGAKMFTIADPVSVYGTVASVVYGIVYWITTLF